METKPDSYNLDKKLIPTVEGGDSMSQPVCSQNFIHFRTYD